MPLRHYIKTYLNGIEAKFITHHVSLVLGDQGLTLADVGAAGAIEYRWKRIEPLINYIGFEPDDRSYKNLITKSHACRSHRLHRKALWSTSTALEFKLCEGSEQSSNFSPNYELVDLFPQKERFKIEKLGTLHACTLDQLLQNNVDFIKIDTQGGELAILQGATARVLDNVLGMELELGIAEIYSNQPLFGDVLNFVKTQQFVFIDFVSLRRWERNDLQTSFGQLVFGDGLFLRSPEYMVKIYN